MPNHASITDLLTAHGYDLLTDAQGDYFSRGDHRIRAEELAGLTVESAAEKWGLNTRGAQNDTLACAIYQSFCLSGAGAPPVSQIYTQISREIIALDDFVSWLEIAPRLPQALAEGLDVSVVCLLELVSTGSLTGNQAMVLLHSQAATIRAEYDLNMSSRVFTVEVKDPA